MLEEAFENETVLTANYGERMTVVFLHRLRDERKFGSLDELRARLQADADRAKELLGQ